MIDNLISNALKFSKYSDRVSVIFSEGKKDVLVKVQDRGTGIPANLLPHVCDSVSKAGRTCLRGEQSSGLVLTIVKQIVESHSGSIEVASVESEGEISTTNLPQAV